ncbi:MAG: transposase [Cyanobacteria bacterium J06631_2]
MKVVGLDVCKLSVVACILSSRPCEPRQFYYAAKFQTFEANAKGISELLALSPDIAVFEPTGVNYSKLWGTHLARAGIEVRLVGHSQLRSYRKNTLELPDKDDQADALALACYYFDHVNKPHRFVQIREPEIVKIREHVLRLAHLNRCQSPVVNRLRQDLAWQFPEIAKIKLNKNGDHLSLVLRWLAGEVESKKYEKLLEQSVGLGLTATVSYHAQRLCHLHREEVETEGFLLLLTQNPKFELYQKVFDQFGFGQRIQGMLLSQIYPLENYLSEEGKPIVIYRKGRNSGKTTKRYLSRRRFEKALGIAPTEDSSGDKKGKKIIGGSDLCRLSLWQWIFVRLEVRRNRPKTIIGAKLGNYLDQEKATGKPIRLVRMRVAAKAVRLLFKELVKEKNR